MGDECLSLGSKKRLGKNFGENEKLFVEFPNHMQSHECPNELNRESIGSGLELEKGSHYLKSDTAEHLSKTHMTGRCVGCMGREPYASGVVNVEGNDYQSNGNIVPS